MLKISIFCEPHAVINIANDIELVVLLQDLDYYNSGFTDITLLDYFISRVFIIYRLINTSLLR